MNIPCGTIIGMVEKINNLETQPKFLIVHVGTNDLTNDVNLLNNVKKIVTKTKKKSLNTVVTFSNIITRKDKRSLEKLRSDTNDKFKI